MAESIESFVAQLQTEGVQAGEQAAEKLRREAEQQAEQIISQAQGEAEKITAQAKAEAESTLARSQTELELAVRDTEARLRTSLNQALTKILLQFVKEPLSDAEFLKSLIHDVVMQYAKADIEGVETTRIGVSPEMHKQLAEWAIHELHEAAMGEGVGIDLKAELRQGGFEYSVTGGTVEVTEESVVASLAELVSASLREMLTEALTAKAE